MSPRPPPKISLRHDWTRGEVPLGSTHDQQSEGEVVRQSQEEVARRAKFFQPTQPIPKPNCDRSGQPDNTQDVFIVKGETSRSQEIDVKSFHEELCSSDRSGQPDFTQDVIGVQTRLSEEIRMSELNKLMIDEGNLINAAMQYIMRSRCSTPTMSSFVKELRRTWTSKFQEYHIPL